MVSLSWRHDTGQASGWSRIRVISRGNLNNHRAHHRFSVIQEAIYGPDHPNVAQALTNLGLHNMQTGDPVTAVGLLQRAADIRAGVGVDNISISFTLTKREQLSLTQA